MKNRKKKYRFAHKVPLIIPTMFCTLLVKTSAQDPDRMCAEGPVDLKERDERTRTRCCDAVPSYQRLRARVDNRHTFDGNTMVSRRACFK